MTRVVITPGLKSKLGSKIGHLVVKRGRSGDSLLLIDEPSEGLAPMIVADLFAIIKEMKQAGCAILLVEQNVHQALTVCDQFGVIERGRIVLSGRANDKSDREKLLATIAV